MFDTTSRREFLHRTAIAAGAVSWPLERTLAAGPPAPLSSSPVAGEESTGAAGCAVFREVCPQHYELLKLRSAKAHEAIAASLRQADARPVTVGAWQMRNQCGGQQGKRDNLGRMMDAMDRAAREGVQVLAFPEMCLPGYFTGAAGTPTEAARANHELADQVGQSECLKQLAERARAKRMVVALGFCERERDCHYNAVGVIDADGRWLGTRRKNPLSPTPYDLESFTQPDPAQRCAVFRTHYATVGLSDCFDGEFPESVRRMRLMGAEVLLWCNAATGNVATGSSNRLHHSASYAQANVMWVVCCNAVGKDCYGTSLIVGPSGEPQVMLPTDQESLGVAKINLTLSANWDRYRQRLDPKWRS